jgi:hypothetical protein
LLALQAQPDLWERYIHTTHLGKVQDGGILFSRQDFLAPDNSLLMQELEQQGDARVKVAVRELKRACREPVERVRFPLQIIDPEHEKKVALQRFELALQNDDDDAAILKAWDASLLDTYQPAQRHKPRLERARQTVQALKHFRTLLRSGNVQDILATYDPLLQTSKAMTKEERRLVTISQSIDRALKDDNDQALNAVYSEIQSLQYGSFFRFTGDEERRITRHAGV